MGVELQPKSIVAERKPNVKVTETFNILLPNERKIAIPGFMQAQILNLLVERDRKNKTLESRDLLDLFDARIPYPRRRQRVRMAITNLRRKLAEHDLTIYAMDYKQKGALASYRLGKKGLTRLEIKSLFSKNGASESKPQENNNLLTLPDGRTARKGQVSENPISDKEIPVSTNGNNSAGNSSPAQEPANLASQGVASQGETLQRQGQPLNIPRNGRVSEIPKLSVLPKREKRRQIAGIEANLAEIAISQLMTSLEKANHSPFELLHKAAPEDISLESLQGIWPHGELVEYIIECVTKTAEKVWNTESLTLLSEKERQFLRTFTSLGKAGYSIERIERVLRLLFSAPAQASIPVASAQAQAN